MKNKMYVACHQRLEDEIIGKREVIFTDDPTPNAHPGVLALIGPFRTRRAAEWMADRTRGMNNPHCRNVAEAEKLAKKFQSEYNPRTKSWGGIGGNIFWRDIKMTDIVTERPHVFIVNGTHVVNWGSQDAIDNGTHVVNWGSQDAIEAQQWLKRRAKADFARVAKAVYEFPPLS